MKRIPATFAVLALSFFALGVNGIDLGLPDFITSNRFGLFFLTGSILWIPLNKVKVPLDSRRPALVLAGIGLWGVLSLLLSNSDLAKGAAFTTSWFLVAYASLAFAVVFFWIIPSQKSWFVNLMALVGGVLPLVTLGFLAIKHGPDIFFRIMPLRNVLGTLGVGLNRFMNGLFLLSAIPTAAILGVVRCRRPVYIISLIGVAGFIFLSLTTGSRQTVGAISFYILALLIFGTIFDRFSGSGEQVSRKKKWLLSIVALVSLSLMIQFIFQQEKMAFTIERRLVDKTEQQVSEGQIRLILARIAWDISIEHPVFGIGPGSFPDSPANYYGLYPHNGYIGVMVEYGFIPLLVFLSLIFSTILTAWNRRGDVYLRENGELLKCTFSFCLVFAVWTINFNDLAREYFFWAFLVLMIIIRFKPEIVAGTDE